MRLKDRMDEESRKRFSQLPPETQIKRLHQFVNSLYGKLERLREVHRVILAQNAELKKGNKTLHARLIRERGGAPETQVKDLVGKQ